MKTRAILWAFICLALTGFSTSLLFCAEKTVDHFFDKLLRIPRGIQVLQTSSHNKTGQNWDEYWPQYVDENGEEVIFDATGPGCVKSMWGTNFDPEAVIKLYFDGEKKARYQAKITDFYKGSHPDFPRPLVSYERRGKYGDNPFAGNAFVPIPFEKSLKITVRGTAHFYHILYERYPFGADLKSFAGKEAHSPLLDAFAYRFNEQVETLDRISFNREEPLIPGEPVILFSIKEQAGIIRELVLEGDGSEDFFQRTRLRMNWDKSVRFQVLAPVGIFFGSAVRANDTRSLPLDVKKLDYGRVRLRCRFPMPFWEEAEIQIVNLSGRKLAPLKASLVIGANPIPRDEGTHFTTMYHEGETVYGHDWMLFESTGSGWYAGTVQSMQFQHYCEGDEHFYMDGALSPQINGTGSEDYYLACFWPNLDFDMPFGCVAGDVAIEGGGYLSGYYTRPSSYSRYHLEAPIPFYSGLSAKIQHGGLSHIQSRYRSLAFAYCSPRILLTQTDFLDVGNAVSEKAHGYSCSDVSAIRLLDSHPEGDFFEASIRGEGRYHKGGSISFDVAVNQDNGGVRIRRRLDQEVSCQGARVFVDGRYAGTWYWGYRNEFLRWYEQDFDLPAGLTREKSVLRIRLELLSPVFVQIPDPEAREIRYPGTIFTDFSYSVFCFDSTRGGL